MNVSARLCLAALCASLLAALPAAQPRVAGSGVGGNSPFATDAYPGFDGLDDLPKPERREKGWFLSVSCPTPAEQLVFAQQLEQDGDFKKAAKQYDALVREWPASKEAPKAQLRFAQLLALKLDDLEEAFEQYEYLLDFYARDCAYLEIVDYEYKLVNLMIRERRTWFGICFLSDRQMRQHYESIVRRAPGASYVPEALLKIADLREKDQQYEEAVKVYGMLATRFPLVPEARVAAYREARARMWLCRRLAYNAPRCRDTVGYLEMTIRDRPDLPELEELKTWLQELKAFSEEDAYKRACFYDSRQRTPHAAYESYARFLRDYPKSAHADEVRARMDVLKGHMVPAAARTLNNEEKKEKSE